MIFFRRQPAKPVKIQKTAEFDKVETSDEKEEDDDDRVFPKASFTCGEQHNLVAVFLFDLRANGCTCQLNSFLSSGKNVVVTSHSFAIKNQHLLASQILFSPS